MVTSLIVTFSDTGYNLMENIISLKINITREGQISEKSKSELTEINTRDWTMFTIHQLNGIICRKFTN